jgi:Domain of unknown function (DUF4262)
MCRICDGTDQRSLLDHVHDAIRVYGWAIQSVAGAGRRPGWAYTVGLLRSYQHRELVMLSHDPIGAGEILNEIASYVRGGGVLMPGDTIELPDGVGDLIAVHPVHVHGGLMAIGTAVNEMNANVRVERFEALQVRPAGCIEVEADPFLRQRLDVPYARTP